jgi:hypothetical protein
MALVLAHQGGWDELLMFLLPIALVVGTWFVMERRRSNNPTHHDDPTAGDDTPTGHANHPETPPS